MKHLLLTLFALLAAPNAFTKETFKQVKVSVEVTEKGFAPSLVDLKPGSDAILEVTRKTESTCAKQVQIPSKNIKVELPLNKPVSISLGKLEKGEIRFGCGMNMMEAGRIIVR